MQWQRINWKNCTVHFRETKTGERHQPFPTAMLAELRSLHNSLANNEGFISSANTKTGHINDMNRPYKKLCKDAGPQDVCTPHCMRHTRVTDLVEAGFPGNVIKEITGHATNMMIAHYSSLRGSTAVRAVVDHCDAQAAEPNSPFSFCHGHSSGVPFVSARSESSVEKTVPAPDSMLHKRASP